MKGVEFVIDEDGKKKAVLIDLRRHGELWDDFPPIANVVISHYFYLDSMTHMEYFH